MPRRKSDIPGSGGRGRGLPPGPPRPADLPGWLEDFRPDDDILARGYEQTPAERRAALKTGLAFMHALHGEQADFSGSALAASGSGFFLRADTVPASAAVAVFPHDYASAPRLASVFMAARLAGARDIVAVSLGGPPSAPACAALELCGVEDVFALSPEQAARAVAETATLNPGARLAALGAWRQEAEAALRAAAQADMPLFAEKRPPRIKIQKNSGHDQEIIAWSHPDALKSSPLPPDVFYCAGQTPNHAAPLTLLPGLEAAWLHPGLEPGFFRRRFILAAPYNTDQNAYTPG